MALLSECSTEFTSENVVSFLEPSSTLLVRKLVKKYVVSQFRVEVCKPLVDRTVRCLTRQNSCSKQSACCMLDVARYAAIVSVLSEASASHTLSKTRQMILTSVKGAGTLSISAAKSRLARHVRKWRSHREHAQDLIAHYVSLCKQEALKATYLKVLDSCAPSKVEKHRRTFNYRMADVRCEILSDRCSCPEMVSGSTSSVWRSSGWRGVNLGGWLLWEPGTADKSPLVEALGHVPRDEWTLCQELLAKYGKEQAESLMWSHRDTYVTRDDFVAMKRMGVNSVRVPFGYWALDPRLDEPFFGNCTEFLDRVLQWGSEIGLSIVLCLHAAVGFQSTEPPCGRANGNWLPHEFDIDATVNVMRELGRRYRSHSALGAICVLNEPHGDMPPQMLNTYFRKVYHVLRHECSLSSSIQLMLPIFQHDFKDFAGVYTEDKGYINVVFDVHCYQVFGDPYAGWCKMSIAQHLRFATGENKQHDARIIFDHGEPVVVSEFSLAMPTWNKENSIGQEHDALTRSEKAMLRRCFALRQLRAYTNYTKGFFFWCWKDDAGAEWSLSESGARDWVPALGGAGGAATPRSERSDMSSRTCDEPLAKRQRLCAPPIVEKTEVGTWNQERGVCSEESTDAGGSSDDGSGEYSEPDLLTDDDFPRMLCCP